MHYDEVRNLIEDGDAILVRGRGGLLTPFTRFFTRSAYTHSGIAFWMDGMLWLFEINGGADHAIPLSQLRSTDFDVYARPVEVDKAKVKSAIFEELRDRTKYGFLALPVIGLLNFCKLKLSLKWRNILVCSGICIRVYERAGYPECTYMLSPSDLSRRLRIKFPVTAT